MAFEKYNLEQFIDALYSGNRSVISEEELSVVYSEYVDIAGLFDTEEFEKICYIHFLENRINSLKIATKLQVDFLEEFGIPYIQNFEFFKKFGYNLVWNNKDGFLSQIEKIKNKELKYIPRIESSIKELNTIRENKNKIKQKEQTQQEKRGSMIRTINSLNKIGYSINKKETTVEEFAYMIKQQTEESKSEK